MAVVVEWKSKSWEAEKLEKWLQSISASKTSFDQRSFTRLAMNIAYEPVKTQKAMRPLCVLWCMNEQKKELSIKSEMKFDVVIRALQEEKRLDIKWDTEKKNLYDWYRCLNQILMLINNPMLSQGLGFGK